MPDHKMHIALDEILFGRNIFFPEVHKFIDQEQKRLQSNHRKMYHDMETVNYIYKATGNNWYAMMSAYFHIVLDMISDEVGQEHAIPELLERMKRGEIRI